MYMYVYVLCMYVYVCMYVCMYVYLCVSGAYPRFSEGVPRSAKEANKPKKRTTDLKPRTCAHQGSMFRPYTSACFVDTSIFKLRL